MSFFSTTAVLIAATMGLVACVGSTPPTVDNAASSGNRSSRPSGVAYRETPVRIVETTPPQVSLGNDPRLGNAEARIGIVEFSDYQCPYCRSFHEQIFPRLKKEYVDTGIAQFIHKDLPLKMHAHAMPAAMAANCAATQGRFWEMHEALYTNQGRLGPGVYAGLARELKLDEEKFSACLKNPAREQEILRDIIEARQLDITGTPSFVIGKIDGHTLTVTSMAKGMPGFEAFAQEIEKLRQQVDTGATPEIK